MPTNYAQEFTPELSEEYLASILNRRVNQGAAAVGEARKEGDQAGLVGQAATGSRIAAAEDNENRGINEDVSRFNLDVANKKYSERMTDQQESFQSAEAQKDRDFRKTMAEMGYQFEDQQREARRKSEHTIGPDVGQGIAIGLGSEVLSKYLIGGGGPTGGGPTGGGMSMPGYNE